MILIVVQDVVLIWVELDGGVCYELGDDSFLLLDPDDADGVASMTTRRKGLWGYRFSAAFCGGYKP